MRLVGELVMSKDELASPSCWSLARTKLFYGQDDAARTADAELRSNILCRPVMKLALLLPDTYSITIARAYTSTAGMGLWWEGRRIFLTHVFIASSRMDL